MIRLETDFAEQRGLVLTQLVEQDILDHMPRFRRVAENRELYHGTATTMMPLPWSGASNIHLPVLMEKVETLVPMIMSAFWGVEPIVNVQRAPEEYYAEQTEDIEQYMNFVVRKDIPNFYETFEAWVRNMGLDGMGWVWPVWVKEQRLVSEVHRLKLMVEQGQELASGNRAQTARPKTATELMVDLFGMPDFSTGMIDSNPAVAVESEEERAAMELNPIGTRWVVRFTEDRRLFEGIVEFDVADHVDEIVARLRRPIMAREGVDVRSLEYDHVVLPYRTRDVQTADRVTVRYWLTIDEVEELVARGEWDLSPEDLDVLRGHGTREDDSSHIDPGLQDQKDRHTGGRDTGQAEAKIRMPEGYACYNKNKIQVFYVCLRDAVEPGGERCEVIYQIPHALRKIVRADYLDEIYPHGRRPFICTKYIPVSDRAYGLGLGDQLAAINLECNTIINYVNNAQELVTNPFFFYEPSALTADSEGLESVKPGQAIPVMNVKGIYFPVFPQQPEKNMEILTSLLMFGDRLTITPLNAGSTQMKNAPRTARGTMALLGESHVKVDMLITRLQLGPWTELMEQIHGLHQAMAPDENWYYVTRETERVPVRMSRKMLRGRYEFYFKGNTANTNRAVLQQQAQVRYATLMANPDYGSDPLVRRELTRDFLKYWGDGADPDRLIPSLPGHGSYQHPPMSQRDENQAMMMGVAMAVLPTDDDAQHLSDMDQFERTPAFASMPQHAVGVYASHKQAHLDQMRQKIAAQRMNVGGGMGNNVPQGASLNEPAGNEDTNVLEGGLMR